MLLLSVSRRVICSLGRLHPKIWDIVKRVDILGWIWVKKKNPIGQLELSHVFRIFILYPAKTCVINVWSQVSYVLHIFAPVQKRDVGSKKWIILWDDCLLTSYEVTISRGFSNQIHIWICSRESLVKLQVRSVLFFSNFTTTDSTCHCQFAYSLLTCPLLGHGTGWNSWPWLIGWWWSMRSLGFYIWKCI